MAQATAKITKCMGRAVPRGHRRPHEYGLLADRIPLTAKRRQRGMLIAV
jgi:hypothetical protein